MELKARKDHKDQLARKDPQAPQAQTVSVTIPGVLVILVTGFYEGTKYTIR